MTEVVEEVTEEYKQIQLDAESCEMQHQVWMDGQRRWVQFLFHPLTRGMQILDCACGQGVGLMSLRSMGFDFVTGVELNERKAKAARTTGYQVIEADMHDLSMISGASKHVIYSSHTLEHAKYPGVVLSEWNRILTPGGILFLILPYPDMGEKNNEVHCGKFALGTNVEDQAQTVIDVVKERGFSHVNTLFDGYRESEVMLGFVKPL